MSTHSVISKSVENIFRKMILLKQKQNDYIYKDYLSRTPLHYLCYCFHTFPLLSPMFSYLFQKLTVSFSLNFKDKFGRTPLHYAALRGFKLNNYLKDADKLKQSDVYTSSIDVFGTTPAQLEDLIKKYYVDKSIRNDKIQFNLRKCMIHREHPFPRRLKIKDIQMIQVNRLVKLCQI